VHPLLVAGVPILSMYAAIPGISRLDELLVSLFFAVLGAALLMAVAGAAYRDMRKAALLATAILVVLVSFDTLYKPLEMWDIAGFRPARRRYILPVTYLALAAFAVWLYRSRRNFGVLTGLANVVALGAFLPPAVVLGSSLVAAAQGAAEDPAPPRVQAAAAPSRTPDIYYLMFDRYGDERTLRANGVDPEPFYDWLGERGFYVAHDSRSNYLKTVLSIASSLNMSYLDEIARNEGPRSGNWLPVYDWVYRHQVGAFLRAQGYRYYHLGSWYWPTRENPQATQNINYYVTVPRPVVRMFDSIFTQPLQRALGPLMDERRQQWVRIRRQVDDVLEIVPQPGPKFVFLHALIPHPPYVFGPDGSYVSLDQESRRSSEENYANQVHAANAMIRRMVERILAESKEPPVIILQGDEGPYPQGTEAVDFEWRRATRDQLLSKTGILNAYHLPCAGARDLYPHVTPVNSFRIVFNTCFGTALPILPDRVIRHASDVRPYAFDDITDVLQRETADAAVRTALP
jgi:hypothetical protein